MKKNISLIFFNLSFIYFLQAQTIQGIPIKTIQEIVSDSTSIYYHPYLLKKFLLPDIGLKNIDYVMLYYGNAFQTNYDPYNNAILEDSLASLTNQKKGKEALELANELLQKNPLSIFGNIEKAYVLNAIQKEDESNKFYTYYLRLIEAIESSGVGNSYENPIVLTSPKDAEAIILRYKLNVVSKSINGSNGKYYEVYLVRNQEKKQYPIYFDITLPYTIALKKLQKDNKN